MEIIDCKVCGSKVKKSQWNKHLETKKHKSKSSGEEEEVEIIIDSKKCRKCLANRKLDMYLGDNATCNVCLDGWKKWAGKNEDKVREINKRYKDEHKDEINEYNKEYSLREVDCLICGCKVRKCKWARHIKSKKHMLGVSGENNGDIGEGGMGR